MCCQSSYSSHSPPNIGKSLQPFEQPSLKAPLVSTSCSTNNNEQQPITTNQQPTNHTDTQQHTQAHLHTHTNNTHTHTPTTTTTTTTTSVTSWVKTSPMYRGGVSGPFRSVGTVKVLFSCLRLHISLFIHDVSPHSCSVFGAWTVSNSEGGLFWYRRRSVTLATLRLCRATRRFAASGVARPSQGPAVMSVFSSCGFSLRCSVAMPLLRQKEFSSAIVWVLLVGCFLHRLGGCDEDVDASWYDFGS